MKILLKTLMLGTLASLSALVFAADTVKFQGQVVPSTCNTTVNGSSGDATVLLPSVNVNDFTLPNSQAGETSFEIRVSECNTSATGLLIQLALANNRPNSGSMMNLVGDGFAKGIDILLGNSPGSSVPLPQGNDLVVTTIPLQGSPGTPRSGSKTLYVKYFRWESSIVTPGKVRGSAQYIITYP